MESKISRRLKQPLAKEVIQYIFLPRLNREFSANFELLNQINLAHAVMLRERGILDNEASERLVSALLKMRQDGPHAVELDPAREEAYFNYEAHLMKLVGHDLGGRLHTARSRNDMGATIDRMRAQNFCLRLGAALADLIDTALAQAKAYADYVMPGYTHLQAAQPITYGYYLSALVDAWTRDLERLLHALDTTDGSPLGSCALAGTSFPIDRTSTSQMLGFSHPLGNALDGVASRDFALELSAAISIMMITCSRMVQDFYVWSTPEFGYLSFPDSVASTSSIMPQKKNPVVLEFLRGKTSHLIGLTAATFTTVKSTHFSHAGDSSRESTRTCWEGCEEALKALELMKLLVLEVEPNRKRMVKRATEDFSTVTDLADLLVRRAGVSFRDAHHIIGGIVREVLDSGSSAKEITSTMINDTATRQLGRQICLNEDEVSECLDPVRNVAARQSYGGPAPSLVLPRIDVQRERLLKQRRMLEATAQHVSDAEDLLRARVESIVSKVDAS